MLHFYRLFFVLQLLLLAGNIGASESTKTSDVSHQTEKTTVSQKGITKNWEKAIIMARIAGIFSLSFYLSTLVLLTLFDTRIQQPDHSLSRHPEYLVLASAAAALAIATAVGNYYKQMNFLGQFVTNVAAGTAATLIGFLMATALYSYTRGRHAPVGH